MPHEKTVVMSFHGLADDAKEWTVYRVRTKNGSWYALGVRQAEGQRALVVVTNVRFAKEANELREAQDSAPLIGGRPLLSMPYKDWIGHSLEVGSLKTSPLVSVDPETDPHVIEEVSRVSIAPYESMRPARPPYPLRDVELAELLANLLHRLYDKPDLFRDVRGHKDLDRRLRASLEMSAQLFRVLSERAREG